MDVVSRYLVECFATLLTTPAVASNSMRSQVNVHTVPSLELLSTLFTTKWTILGMFEKHMQLHMPFSIELPRTVGAVIVGPRTFFRLHIPCMTCHVLCQIFFIKEVAATRLTKVNLIWVISMHVDCQFITFFCIETAVGNPT